MKRILLLGSYGQTNLGDDLLMFNYIQFLKDRGCEEIIVNANTAKNIPEAVKRIAPKLRVIETYNSTPVEFIKTIAASNAVVYGGGTVFKELYSSTGRSKYSVIARILMFNLVARLFGKPIYNLHIGTGAIKTGIGRLITKWSLSLSTLTIFRDRTSFEYARKTLHVPAKKIEYSTDGLFLNPAWRKPWQKAPLRPPRGKTIIGINLLSDIPDWINREEYLANMRSLVNQLLDDKENFVIFMPLQHAFNPHNDLVFMQQEIVPYIESRKNFAVLGEMPLDFVNSYFRQVDIFVGMRFHSLLLSAVNETPFVSISYDTKCTRFLKESDYPFAVPLEHATPELVIKTYQKLAKNQGRAKELLAHIAEKNFRRARKHLERIEL